MSKTLSTETDPSDRGIDASTNTYFSLLQKVDKESLEEHTSNVKETLKQMCAMDLGYLGAYESVGNKLKGCSETGNNWLKKLEVAIREEVAKMDSQAYSSHELWHKYQRKYPDIFVETDESIVCTQSSSSNLDPLTKQPINVPCKSSACGHLYDHDSIVSYIASKGDSKNIRCPYVACNSMLDANNIVMVNQQ